MKETEKMKDMKDQVNFLWEDFFDFHHQEFKTWMNAWGYKTSFPYGADEISQNEKKKMVTGLLFWHFMRHVVSKKSRSEMKKTRRSLFDIIKNQPAAKENRYLTIVAMIESLPNTVWRKLLWRENIDFVSFEACLRRLNNEQIKAIEENYDDLFSSQHAARIPRVFKKSWRDKTKIFFGKITVNSILKEKYNLEKRYQSKGAYAFNLLGLDFGFSLYPKGNNNDIQITNKKLTRFLSAKEHINDFIVNQEDGKYWWLYKKVRSNYAFFPNKEVQIKTHICPGFWKTLIIQALFWIVSPLALIATGAAIMQNGISEQTLAPAILALPMIIWGLAALLRLLFNFGLQPLWKRVINPAWQWTQKNKRMNFIIYPFFAIFLLAFFGVCAFMFFNLIWIIFKALLPIAGPLLTVLFLLSLLFYIFFLLVCVGKEKPLFRYKNMPKFLKLAIPFPIAALAIVLFDKYLTYVLVNFFVEAAKSIWFLYTDNLLLANWLILISIFFGVFTYFFLTFTDDEKRFVKYERLFTLLIGGVALVIGAIYFTMILQSDVFSAPWSGIIILLIIILVTLSFLMKKRVNKENIEEREELRKTLFALDIADRVSGAYVTMLLKSSWLNKLEPAKKKEMLEVITILAGAFFRHGGSSREDFFELLVNKGSQKILDTLVMHSQAIKNAYTPYEKWVMIKMLCNGKSLRQAEKFIERKQTVKQKTNQTVKIFFRILLWPIKYVAKKIWWFLKKVWEIISTLRFLWELFNKLCPYVSEQKLLN